VEHSSDEDHGHMVNRMVTTCDTRSYRWHLGASAAQYDRQQSLTNRCTNTSGSCSAGGLRSCPERPAAVTKKDCVTVWIIEYLLNLTEWDRLQC